MLGRSALFLIVVGAIAACEAPATGSGGADASSSGGSAAGSDVAMPAGLSSDERIIWQSLNPTAKAQASE